jgi:hypothetical protein
MVALENDANIRISDENGMCQVAKGSFEELFLEKDSTRARCC